MLSVWQHERLLELSPMAFGRHLTKINVTQCNVMSMWSLRWHLTNKSVTGAPYSIKHYSLPHSWTLWRRVQWLKHAVPSWGRGRTAAAMTAQNEHWKEHQYNSNSTRVTERDYLWWTVRGSMQATTIWVGRCAALSLSVSRPRLPSYNTTTKHEPEMPSVPSVLLVGRQKEHPACKHWVTRC